MWTVIAHPLDCEDGACPTIWTDETGRARVRGSDPEHPDRELDVIIGAATWAQLRAQLR